jgi:hypothetical protein
MRFIGVTQPIGGRAPKLPFVDKAANPMLAERERRGVVERSLSASERGSEIADILVLALGVIF